MIVSKYERLILFIQDLVVLVFSLWLTLVLRYLVFPTQTVFVEHLQPFAVLLVAWFVVYYIAGLYEKQSSLWKKRLPMRLVRAQLVNAGIAIAFFYLIAYFSISPKTVLFLYLVISSLLLIGVRLLVLRFFVPRRKTQALLVAGGEEKDALAREINENSRYGMVFSSVIDLNAVGGHELIDRIVTETRRGDIKTVIIDLDHPKIQQAIGQVYGLLFSQVTFVNFNKVYESVFDRIPLSSVTHGWFLEHISLQPRSAYDFVKRVTDILLAGIGFIVSLPFYALAYVLIKLDDGGPLFVIQERVGQYNRPIRITKFRSMTTNDAGDYGTATAKANKITRVGSFLRKSRIDELPQLLSVLRGDQSLIGPRPELPALVSQYDAEIPYYNVRHMIKPGLSGWAQIYGEHGHGMVAVEFTKNKLSYDLFYVKNRSILLDLIITLKTIQILLSFVGK